VFWVAAPVELTNLIPVSGIRYLARTTVVLFGEPEGAMTYHSKLLVERDFPAFIPPETRIFGRGIWLTKEYPIDVLPVTKRMKSNSQLKDHRIHLKPGRMDAWWSSLQFQMDAEVRNFSRHKSFTTTRREK
jgi:hypothetical protein